MTSAGAIVWLAISISCSGHVNSNCNLHTFSHPDRDACMKAISHEVHEYEYEGFFTRTIKSTQIVPKPNAMCIPVAGEPILPPDNVLRGGN